MGQLEDNDPCRAPPRCGEREGGLGITPPGRFQQLDAPTRGAAEQGGPILDRPFRVEEQCTASGVLQLETRPTCPSSGRFLHTMEGSQSIPFHPIHADSPVPQQDNRGEVNGSADSPSLAEPGVVSSTIGQPGCPSSASPSNAGHCVQPETSPGGGRSSPSSRMVCVGRSCSTQGLSERVTEIIQKLWRALTESVYSNTWRQWVGWCLERETDPGCTRVPLREVRSRKTVSNHQNTEVSNIDDTRGGGRCQGWSTPNGISFSEGCVQPTASSTKIHSDLECGCGS